MEVEEEVAGGVQGDARALVQETAKTSVSLRLLFTRFGLLLILLLFRLGSTRKKRKPAADHATPDAVKTYSQTLAIPSLHGAKPPGISALDIGHGAASHLMVTGGYEASLVGVNGRLTGCM